MNLIIRAHRCVSINSCISTNIISSSTSSYRNSTNSRGYSRGSIDQTRNLSTIRTKPTDLNKFTDLSTNSSFSKHLFNDDKSFNSVSSSFMDVMSVEYPKIIKRDQFSQRSTMSRIGDIPASHSTDVHSLYMDMKSAEKMILNKYLPINGSQTMHSSNDVSYQSFESRKNTDKFMSEMSTLSSSVSGGHSVLSSLKSTTVVLPSIKDNTEEIHATSVKRKRRLKMNRHKYKKRRRAQRALRRRLGR